MRAHHVQLGLVVPLGLLLGACEDPPNEADPIAPEVTNTVSTVSRAAGAQTFHFKARGRQAQVFFFSEDSDGALTGDVQVLRSETKSGLETFLFYSVQRCDFISGECQEVEGGSGMIPNSNLAISDGEASLHTNTSLAANPDFFRTAGEGGVITLHWTKASASVQKFHSHTQTRIGGVLIDHSQFAGTFFSALIEGTALDAAVSAGNSGGSLGTVRSGSVVIQKAQ